MSLKESADHYDTEPKPLKMCCAGGCPLVGTYGKSTKGNDILYCSYHGLSEDKKQWPAITERIIEVQGLIHLRSEVNRNPAEYFNNMKKVVYDKDKEFSWNGEESWGMWLDRTFLYLNRYIMQGVALRGTKQTDGPKQLSELIDQYQL